MFVPNRAKQSTNNWQSSLPRTSLFDTRVTLNCCPWALRQNIVSTEIITSYNCIRHIWRAKQPCQAYADTGSEDPHSREQKLVQFNFMQNGVATKINTSYYRVIRHITTIWHISALLQHITVLLWYIITLHLTTLLRHVTALIKICMWP